MSEKHGREEFEAWAQSQFLDLTPEFGKYRSEAACAALAAWSFLKSSGSTDDRTVDEWKAKFFAEQQHRMELQAALDTVMPGAPADFASANMTPEQAMRGGV